MNDLAPMDIAARLPRLRSRFDELQCEALLVTNLTNIRYLTGFTGSAAMLLVTEDCVQFTTDGRYKFQSEEQLRSAGVEAEITVGGLAEQKGAITSAASSLVRLGLEASEVTWAQQRKMAEDWFACDLVPTTEAVETLRLVKDSGEVERVRAAGHIADNALATCRSMLLDGVTEAELAVALDFEIRRQGATNSFDTIVASGPNAAKPHAQPSSRRIEEGELIVIDFGAKVDGYCSDMTRTLCVGEPRTEKLRRMVSVVEQSQREGVSAVRPGNSCGEVDRVCREVIEEAGWGDAFLHSTGHGVGLDIHELPWVAAKSGATLVPGNVVTVEPGVYLSDEGGVRIEDTVVVTGDGSEALTCAPKLLQVS